MKDFNAGTYVNQGSYSAFIPERINRPWEVFDMKVINLLDKASRALGELNMYSNYVDVDHFIPTHVAKEATLSTRIEGTQTQMEETFLSREEIPSDRRDDWDEVHNYIRAMNESVALLESIPFSLRLLRDAHRILISGVRGSNKHPGEFRTSQNWIGGRDISSASFVPPPAYMVPELMSDMEAFAHNESLYVPDLLRIAIMHYQFETIHPFLDGNGRLGRLMITLFLVDKNILRRPILYLSDYLEHHREEYFKTLTEVRERGDLAGWLKFFLQGVVETANKGIDTLDGILRIESELDERLAPLGNRAADARKVLGELKSKNSASVSDISDWIGKSRPTAYKLVEDLEGMGLLSEITGQSINKVYVYKDYIDLFR